MNLVMLGFLVSDEAFYRYSKNDPNPQVAARNFETGFLDGFIKNKLNVTVLASMPASSFPHCRKIFFECERFERNGVKCVSVPFINLPGFKGVTRFLSALLNLVIVFNKLSKQNTALCVYSMHSPYLLAAYLLNLSCGIKYFLIVPDLPQYMSEGLNRGWIYSLLKKVDLHFIRFLIKRSSGSSVITSAMLEVFPEMKHSPSVVIEGIAKSFELIQPRPKINALSTHQRPYFLYAGGLNEAYGIGTLVREFHASNLEAELWLLGKGPLVKLIGDTSLKDDRIRYFGHVSQDALIECYAGASALLITRSPNDVFVKYSFPSKLIDYMSSGVPVICTKLPGIPSEYFEYLNVFESDQIPLGAFLSTFLAIDVNARSRMGLDAYDFIKRYKTDRVQVAKFLDIIRLALN